jgi:sugar/nucleoside kinase (ribokinase family)
MFDIITFGSATWDVFLKLKNYQELKSKQFIKGKGICFNLGSKVDVEDIYLFSGGGGTNAAATFVKQGFRTAYFGTIGNDLAGKEIIKELKKLRIDTRFVSKTNLKPTNYSVIFNTGSNKDRTVLAYRGASELLGKRNIPWKKLKKAKWFYLAPLSGKASKLTKDIVDFAYENKIKIAFNPGNSQLSLPTATLKAILKKIDILFLNQEEASLLTKIPYKQKREIFKKLDKMCSGIAIIGSSEGTLISDNINLYQTKIPIIKIVDKTGAGDAFTSGFVSGFIKKGDIEYAIQLAIANSASCMQQRGAKQGLLKKNEKFRKVKIEKKKL